MVPKIQFLLQKEKQRDARVHVSITGASITGSSGGAAGRSRFFSASSSSEEEGLLVLSHPKTEAELRERVSQLEGRLKKFAARCTCEQGGSQGSSSLVVPIFDAPEQASNPDSKASSSVPDKREVAGAEEGQAEQAEEGRVEEA